MASSRVQAERNVRYAQCGLHTGMRNLQRPNSLKGFNAVTPSFVLTGCNRKSKHVYRDVAVAKSPVQSQIFDQTMSHREFVFFRSSLPSLVNSQRDNRSAVLFNQRHDFGKARRLAITIFIVDRVHHRATAE